MNDDGVFFGMVKTFDAFKGWGFITRDKGKDVFFFYSEINGDDKYLSAGDQVSFTIQALAKGPRAYNISKI